MPNRRNFFRWLAGEVCAACDEMRGIPQLRLSDISALSDAELAEIRPVVREGVRIIVREEHVFAEVSDDRDAVALFPVDSTDTLGFNRFDGQKRMRQIGDELAAAMSSQEADGFAHVRGLFLRLVDLGVCVPGSPRG